jgi:prepilin-type N-terminal cleavage/methylation domain-containing protein
MMKLRRRLGFTLLELLIALLVISTGATATVEAIRYAHGVNIKARYRLYALAIAQSTIETAKAAPTRTAGTVNIASLNGLPSGSTGTVTYTKDAVRTNLWTVQVVVAWTAGGRLGNLSNSVTLETMVYGP